MTISQIRAELASQRMENRAGLSFSRATSGRSVSDQKPRHLQLGEMARMESGQEGLRRQQASKDTEAVTVSGSTK